MLIQQVLIQQENIHIRILLKECQVQTVVHQDMQVVETQQFINHHHLVLIHIQLQ